MIDKNKLFKQLSTEYKLEKQQEKFKKQLEQLDKIISSSKSYAEYKKKSEQFLNELKKNRPDSYEHAIWYGKNHCYHLKPKWRKYFEIENFKISFIAGGNPFDPEDTIEDFFNDQELFNTKYKDEKYIIEQLIFSSKPKGKEKENLIDRLLVFFKTNLDIYEFIDFWIKMLIKAQHENNKSNLLAIQQLRQDRIYLYEYITTRKILIDKSNFDETKIFFEHDMKIVQENENFYPIMFVYEDYIKKEILKSKYKKGTIKEVFNFIKKLTLTKKVSAIKQMYYNTYLPNVKFKK